MLDRMKVFLAWVWAMLLFVGGAILGLRAVAHVIHFLGAWADLPWWMWALIGAVFALITGWSHRTLTADD